MALVEGVGDEVTAFVMVLLVLVVTILAWWSTSVHDVPSIRGLVILEPLDDANSTPVSVSSQNQTQTSQESASDLPISVTETKSSDVSEQNQVAELSQTQQELLEEGPPVSTAAEAECLEMSEQIQEEERQFGRISEQGSNVSGVSQSLPDGEGGVGQSENSAQPGSHCEIRKRNGVKEQETCATCGDSGVDGPRTPICADTQQAAEAEEGIKIRLKFLNDTQRLVEARLEEPLGDFKRRHFGLEMAANRFVRLIFNGQLLSQEGRTLAQCGLFDNCVVHCHVSQSQPNAATQSQARDSAEEAEGDLDIGGFMLPVFGVVMVLMWCFRFQYGQYFNATSTLALIGLSALLVVSAFTVYFPTVDVNN